MVPHVSQFLAKVCLSAVLQGHRHDMVNYLHQSIPQWKAKEELACHIGPNLGYFTVISSHSRCRKLVTGGSTTLKE